MGNPSILPGRPQKFVAGLPRSCRAARAPATSSPASAAVVSRSASGCLLQRRKVRDSQHPHLAATRRTEEHWPLGAHDAGPGTSKLVRAPRPVDALPAPHRAALCLCASSARRCVEYAKGAHILLPRCGTVAASTTRAPMRRRRRYLFSSISSQQARQLLCGHRRSLIKEQFGSRHGASGPLRSVHGL